MLSFAANKDESFKCRTLLTFLHHLFSSFQRRFCFTHFPTSQKTMFGEIARLNAFSLFIFLKLHLALMCQIILAKISSMLFQLAFFALLQASGVFGQCTNGGTWVATGCTASNQCTPYSTQPTVCLNGQCCTTNTTTVVPTIPVTNNCNNGGTFVASGCTNSYQCALRTTQPVACYSGTCCTVSD